MAMAMFPGMQLRGNPKVLFNVHLDTVPVGDGWNSNPHGTAGHQRTRHWPRQLRYQGCGSSTAGPGPGQGADNLALLFTSDEEGAGSLLREQIPGGKRYAHFLTR